MLLCIFESLCAQGLNMDMLKFFYEISIKIPSRTLSGPWANYCRTTLESLTKPELGTALWFRNNTANPG